MTKRTLFTLVIALLAWPTLASTDVTLPFRLADKNVYSATPCHVTIDNQQKTAFRLYGVSRLGKVYYLNQEQALLFEGTTVSSTSNKPFIEATGNQKVHVYFKNTNTFTLQAGFIYGKGEVVLQGNTSSSSNLNVTTKQAMVRSGGDVRLSNLKLKVKASLEAFKNNSGRIATIYFDRIEMTASGAFGNVVDFSDIVTTNCGLPDNYYGKYAVLFDKRSSSKTYHRLTVNGQASTSLTISFAEDYIRFDTRNTPENSQWSNGDAEVFDGLSPTPATTTTTTTSKTGKTATTTTSKTDKTTTTTGRKPGASRRPGTTGGSSATPTSGARKTSKNSKR